MEGRRYFPDDFIVSVKLNWCFKRQPRVTGRWDDAGSFYFVNTIFYLSTCCQQTPAFAWLKGFLNQAARDEGAYVQLHTLTWHMKAHAHTQVFHVQLRSRLSCWGACKQQMLTGTILRQNEPDVLVSSASNVVDYLTSSHVVLCWEEEKWGNRACTCVCSVLIKPGFCINGCL